MYVLITIIQCTCEEIMYLSLVVNKIRSSSYSGSDVFSGASELLGNWPQVTIFMASFHTGFRNATMMMGVGKREMAMKL